MKKDFQIILNLLAVCILMEACGYDGFWGGVNGDIAVTPYGNVIAISCHNCYRHDLNPASSLYGTLYRIHTAQKKNADLIELDIVQQGSHIRVDHNDDGNADGALLSQVLRDDALRSGDEILFIEIKETTISESFIRSVFDMLSANGYGPSRGRPVVLRTFHRLRGHLLHAKSLLEGAYSHLANHILLSELFVKDEASSISGFKDLVLNARADGIDMVEFHYQSHNLYTLISLARSIGLGVNLWTIPVLFGEVFIAALRDEVDVLTVNYDIEKARQIVKDDNGLVYMNSTTQADAGDAVRYYRTGETSFLCGIDPVGAPKYEILRTDENLQESALIFNAEDQQYVPFYDGDNSPGQGYLIAVAVNFDDLALDEGETRSIISKSDSGGFCLELHNPPAGEAVIRFGVKVGSNYRYATYPLANLDTISSFWIVGSYDGKGGVYLWIDNDSGGTVSSSAIGEVVQNDIPILLGADPQEENAPRYHFSGRIQVAIVQDWGGH